MGVAIRPFSLTSLRSTMRAGWPVISAIALHVLILLFFLVSILHTASEERAAQEPHVIQAQFINNQQWQSLVSAKRPVQKDTKPVQEIPKEKVLPKPVDKPIEKPIVAQKPAPKLIKTPELTVLQKTTPQQNTVTQKKLLEQALLQEAHKEQMQQKTQQKSAAQSLLEQELNAETAPKNEATTEGKTVQNAKVQGEVDRYKGLILQQIQQNWLVPQQVENLSCLLQIHVAPGGMVLDVVVLKSSGNSALDRSAIAAVNKASPLPVPKESSAFAAFRTFTLTVKPEDSGG